MNLYNNDGAVPLGHLEHKAAGGEERASEGDYISISVWISRALLKHISQFSALLCFGLPQGSSPRTCKLISCFHWCRDGLHVLRPDDNTDGCPNEPSHKHIVCFFSVPSVCSTGLCGSLQAAAELFSQYDFLFGWQRTMTNVLEHLYPSLITVSKSRWSLLSRSCELLNMYQAEILSAHRGWLSGVSLW